jgi:hydrophobe/amphiphile efflux-1 (HAE1) family protein
MNWVEFFVKRHVLTWMLMFGLIFFGAVAYQKMGISEFPDVDFPVVSIDVNWEGSSPELNEVQVTDPIENAISTVQGIKKIYSSSKTQTATVTAEFELGTNIDNAVQDIQTALARIQRRLPRDIDAPIVSKTNPEDRPILWIGVASKTIPREKLMSLVKDVLRPAFATIPGIADVTLGGYIDPNLRVWIEPEKLQAFELTATDIISTISQEHVELPAGRLETALTETPLRTYGEASSIPDFLNLPITKRGGSPNFSPLRLGQIAEVEMGLADDRSRARSMGEFAVGLGFKKQRGANAVEVGDAVKARMAEIQKQHPELNIGINFDTTTYIKDSIHEMVFTLLFSAILTSLVCWLFLGSFGATINVILAIPTAILGTFIVIQGLGYTLNTFTLLGLSLAIGIVVDDAIMILENISRHKAMGKSSYQAAIDGTKEIFSAVVATSLSLIAIFLPVVFISGIIGTYLLQFGLTLSVAVGLSMVEALTLTPMRCAGMIKLGHEEGKTSWLDRISDKLSFGYKKTLSWAIHHKAITLGIVTVCFLSSFLLIKPIKQEFMPYQDTNRIALILKAPLGVSIGYMDIKFREVEKVLLKTPEMSRYFGSIGGGAINTGRAFVQLKLPKDRPINPKTGKPVSQREVANKLRQQLKSIKGVKVIVQDNSNRAFMERKGFPVELSLKGPDWDKLAGLSADFLKAMQDSKLMTDIDSDYQAGLPEFQIFPNREQAAAMGVSVGEINKTIQSLIGGIVVGQYTKDGYRYDIRMRIANGKRNAVSDIEALSVRNNRGELVPLRSLITIKLRKTVQEITRENKERAITLTANVAPGSSQQQALALMKNLSKTLPSGYKMVLSGSSESFQNSFKGIFIAIGLGLIVAYMVLASQFNSFIQPLVVLLSLPFSVSGAFLALLLGRQSLNMFSLIGIMLVLGIVLKNAIMLVDFTNQKRKAGLPLEEAILEACPLRLRPILMTSIATIVGAFPAALALGPGAETRIPMALSVIGGVVVSTIFTLYVVPCVYALFIKKT